jgi:hypothetical protein
MTENREKAEKRSPKRALGDRKQRKIEKQVTKVGSW